MSTRSLYDPVAERLVLSAILKFGGDVIYDIDPVISSSDFYADENQIIYSALRKLVIDEGISKPDVASLAGVIHQIDPEAIKRLGLTKYIGALNQESITKENVGPFANSIARLGLARNLKSRMELGLSALDKVSSDNTISEIIGIAESPLVEFTNSLIRSDDTIKFGSEIGNYVEYLAEHKNSYLGIPTGFALYDKTIGNGVRGPGIHILGGRAKSFKSTMLLNAGKNMCCAGIPILYLDTELTKEIVMGKLIAMTSEVTIDDIETGKFSESMDTAKKVSEAVKLINDLPFYYHNISGMPHLEVISIMRRWIMKEVGFDGNGQTRPCCIILDYIKTMDVNALRNIAEFQYLGQLMTDYHNFCVKYKIPILSAVQLNREGINGEDQNVIAGSDRIIALCSSFCIIKAKTAEDLATDPIQNGDRKIVYVAGRFGKGLSQGEYINIKTKGEFAQVIEGNLNTANRANRNNVQQDGATLGLDNGEGTGIQL